MKGKKLPLMRCLMLAAAILPCLCSCHDETKLNVKDGSSKDAGPVANVILGAEEGSSETIYVSVEETGWTARVAPDCDFLSVSPAEEKSSSYITIKATQSNTTGADRTGTVYVESTEQKDGKPELSETITVTQKCAEGMYLSLTCPSDAPQHGDFVVLYQPKNGEEWERALTADDYTTDPSNSQIINYRFFQPVDAETGQISLWYRSDSPGYAFKCSYKLSQVTRQVNGNNTTNATISISSSERSIIVTDSKKDYFIDGFKCEPKDGGVSVTTISEEEVKKKEEPEPLVEDAVYLSLYCPSDAPQHGDFIVLYQQKNGEERERTLTADDYTTDPSNSQTIIYHLCQPVDVETGKVSVWFRNNSTGFYSFRSYGNLSWNEYLSSSGSGVDIYVVNAPIFTFSQSISVEELEEEKDHFIMGFKCEPNDNSISVKKTSEMEHWPELNEQQAACLREAVKSMQKDASDAIDAILTDESNFLKEFPFSAILPADLFMGEIELTLVIYHNGEEVLFGGEIKTAPNREIHILFAPTQETAQAKAALTSPDFVEEATARIESTIRGILKDRQATQ